MIERFGTLSDGRSVESVRIGSGLLEARLVTYGARIVSLQMAGLDRSLVLGAPTIDPYLSDMAYFGAIVGRFANRIGDARFELDGQVFRTTPNFRGRHTLHGGGSGLHGKVWTIAELGDDHVVFTISLPDGDEGFPGTLDVAVRYEIAPPSALRMEVTARADRPTPCSIASHAYFRLGSDRDVRDHRLSICADHYLPVDDDLIPTGEVASVAGTAFDFRSMRPIGGHRYDHNFCLADRRLDCRPVASLRSADGRTAMTMSTTEPGLQFYDGENTSLAVDESGSRLPAFAALCLEAQAWPDAPNRPHFPDAILNPGKGFRSETIYEFETQGL